MWKGLKTVVNYNEKKSTPDINFDLNELNKFYARFDAFDFSKEIDEQKEKLSTISNCENECDEIVFTERQVKNEFRKINERKACGPDVGKYQLIYFQVRGRCESIRLLLNDNGIDYEETNCGPREKWIKDYKPQMAFGQVPCLKDGDLSLVQSNAILRYLARKHGLYGSSDVEATMIDILSDGVEDLRKQYTMMIYKNYEAGKDDFITTTLPEQLPYFENFLKKHGDQQSGYSVGQKQSFVDYNLMDLLDALQTLSSTCLDNYPTLASFLKVNLAKPNIAKYRETEPFKTRSINGNGKQ
ncbi:glutathione S-transferase [Elysia marginata]|uniref:glutathione transferase n=1 Tax=Elysia marginata TaxID=1093978 RepID=A0AAV4IT90_9GAST|nr:glutathione S-transferase [Elysia marginata]